MFDNPGDIGMVSNELANLVFVRYSSHICNQAKVEIWYCTL